MKKKLLICSLLVICLATAAFGTTAYFSYEDTAKNVITAGDVKIALLERSASAADGARAPYENTVKVMPSMELSKIIEIENVGSQSAWIRVSVEKMIELAAGIDGEPDASLISLDYNTENWQEKDGYFYYLEELKSGETTRPLFTRVQFSKTMNNQYQNSQAIINIQAQATQYIHNGDTVFDAAGWPNHD